MATSRRLAAIMFTDIVGYTAMMARDEDRALRLLKENAKIHRKWIKAYRGQFLKEMGDGILASFDTPTDAVYCAGVIQEECGKHHIGLRIGIHQGEVVFENGDVFGDGVNIASRIESVAEPGQILVSANVHQNIRNKKGIESTSLGQKQLKGVTDEVEFFTVSLDDSLITEAKPHSRSPGIALGTEDKQKRRKIPLVPFMGLVIIILLAGYLIATVPSQEIIPEEVREARVAVLPFENQTNDETLEFFGLLVSDHLPNAFMEAGTKVVLASNVRDNIEFAQLESPHGMSRFQEVTGAEILIRGRYYVLEDQFILTAYAVDVATGAALDVSWKEEGPKGEMNRLLDDLTQEILGYWAVRDRKLLRQNAPRYDAFQEYILGEDNFTEDFERSEQHLLKAFALDSTFYTPLLKLVVGYGNHGEFGKGDSLIEFISRLPPRHFSPWEKLRFEALEAYSNGNWKLGADAEYEMYLMDPQDDVSNYQAGRNHIRLNPELALEILTSYHDPYGNNDGGRSDGVQAH